MLLCWIIMCDKFFFEGKESNWVNRIIQSSKKFNRIWNLHYLKLLLEIISHIYITYIVSYNAICLLLFEFELIKISCFMIISVWGIENIFSGFLDFRMRRRWLNTSCRESRENFSSSVAFKVRFERSSTVTGLPSLPSFPSLKSFLRHHDLPWLRGYTASSTWKLLK